MFKTKREEISEEVFGELIEEMGVDKNHQISFESFKILMTNMGDQVQDDKIGQPKVIQSSELI